MELPPTGVPEPDMTLEPAGFTVDHDGDRIHFLDWGGPARPRASGVVAIHGLGQTVWAWTPVARRLGGPAGAIRFVAMDLRGHGLSDAPTEDGAYDLDLQGEDVIAVAEGAGVLASPSDRVVLAGHGFGAIVAAHAARDLRDRCAGLVLVDGGWEDIESVSGVDVDQFLRELDEPPEVMRSMSAFLKDRREFDRSTWDADQEQAARATVVETHAGRVVPSARPHATEAAVRAMFEYAPLAVLPLVDAPVSALMGMDDEAGSRAERLDAVSAVRELVHLPPIRTVAFGNIGHNLMRYRPREVAAAVLALGEGA
ncbi:MAG TPA: alpha/beta hydrolase [Candidatus Limnocylindrales bacterium]|jgi:pimeloyl-ACP methyl ester carboxylesterase|nr:alpha/beta hydrolase [Candidatus Limnocylindrales bacterium]